MRAGARKRWAACPPACRSVLLRFGPPLAVALLAALRWWWLWSHGVTGQIAAREVLARAGYALAAAVLVMLLGTRRWTVLMLGVLTVFVALAGLLVRAVGRAGPQPLGEAERDAIQACLEVGSALVLAGAVVWVVVERFGLRRAEAEDPWLLLEEIAAENQRLAGELALCRERLGEG